MFNGHWSALPLTKSLEYYFIFVPPKLEAIVPAIIGIAKAVELTSNIAKVLKSD